MVRCLPPKATGRRASNAGAQKGLSSASKPATPEQLLAVLRQLEQLHRDLQDGPFRSSLPSDRQQLYKLLQAMEQNGGWPYIPRLQLKTFMELLEPGSEHDAPDQSAQAA